MNGNETLGPFLVDIDNDDNIDDAQTVTKQVITYLTKQQELLLDNLRIFFSGHKGFNVEVRPETLEIKGSISDQIKISRKKLGEIISALRNENKIQILEMNIVSKQRTCIDMTYGYRFGYKLKYPYIRLHNSINKWIRSDGSEIARMKIELTAEQLWSMSTPEISSKAEELAQAA